MESPCWTELFSLPTQVTPEIFWKILRFWTSEPLYKQVHKINIQQKIINGKVQEQNEPLEEDYVDDNLICYKRHMYPRDYKRKKEMDDEVTHFVSQNRVVYTHQIQNSSSDLPQYYMKAKKFAFQLIPLTEQDKKDLKIVKSTAITT